MIQQYGDHVDTVDTARTSKKAGNEYDDSLDRWSCDKSNHDP